MDKNQIQSSSYLDIVFDGKNKAYGAYQLRKDYNKRMAIAILAGIVLAAIFFLITAVANKNSTEEDKLVTVETELGEPPPMSENEPPPPPPPPIKAPPPPAQIKFTPPIIKKDQEIKKNDVPDLKDMKDNAISDKTVESERKSTTFVDDVEFDESTTEEIKKVEPVEKPDNKVYEVVEQTPTYPGGNSAIPKDVAKNFEYPQVAIENGVTGRIIVRFIVEKDGSVSDVKVIRGLGYGLDAAAIKAVKKLNKFTPAKQNGKAVRYYYSMPIDCQLN